MDKLVHNYSLIFQSFVNGVKVINHVPYLFYYDGKTRELKSTLTPNVLRRIALITKHMEEQGTMEYDYRDFRIELCIS